MSHNYGLTYEDLSNVRAKIEKQRHYLESETFVTDSGQVKSLLDVSFSANHSERYFSTVLNKVHTFVSYNIHLDLEPVFLTMTLDGFFRDFLRGDFSRWEKHSDLYRDHIPNNDRFGRYLDKIERRESFTSKDLYKILSFQWHRFLRSYTLQKLKRDGLIYNFIRVTEPHKDGVPHFHVLFYLPNRYIPHLYRHFRNFFPAPRNHKIVNRRDNGRVADYLSPDIYETQGFQWKIQSVAGYILKYILKTFRNVKENKDIDYLQAWYVLHRIPRIITSHTLIPQDVYFKSSLLDDDWFYLSLIRLEGFFSCNRIVDYFIFDDGNGRRIIYDSGHYLLTHHGHVIREFGQRRFFWSALKPSSYDICLIDGNYWLQRLYRRKNYIFVPDVSTTKSYTRSRMMQDVVTVDIDGSLSFSWKDRLDLKPSLSYVLPVRRLTLLELVDAYREFDFDIGHPARYGLIHNELVRRGAFDEDYFNLNDFNVDFNFECEDWLRERDLNPRPSGYEPDELPDCSIPRPLKRRYLNPKIQMDGVEGLEPPNDWTKTSCLTTWRYPKRWDINSFVYVDGIIEQSPSFVKTPGEKFAVFFTMGSSHTL